jgi:predicted DNA-binding protein (MmcQ/YjbR family)
VTPAAYNAFCGALPATSHGVQWGGADVWKVGPWETGKVFAIGGSDADGAFRMSFKVSDIGWEMLRDARGCRPAPYLASRGMKWIQADGAGGLSRSELESLLAQSHALVAAGFSKRRRIELGLG